MAFQRFAMRKAENAFYVIWRIIQMAFFIFQNNFFSWKGRMKMNQKTKKLVLGGVLVALGTVLSFIKVFDLPQGGSITLCSMLPVMLFAYMCGIKWGLAAGFTLSVLQLLFGLNALKGISGVTVAGSILLDYLLAFTVLGLAGIFRNKIKNDPAAFTLGCLISGLLRYLCSFLSGWLLWSEYASADFFPPLLGGMSGSTLACFYSLAYNGSYMIPEIIITCIAAFLVMQFAGKQLLKLADSGVVGPETKES